MLTPEEAERHPQRSAITRAVGTERAIEADVFAIPVSVGDLFLICSDGLTDMLSEDEIAQSLLAAEREPTAAAESLVAAANANGGEDNITVVLFELVEGEPEPIAEPDEEESAPVSDEDTAADGGPPAAPAVAEDDVSRHGAGDGGRLAAIGLIVGLLLLGALVLYWGIR